MSTWQIIILAVMAYWLVFVPLFVLWWSALHKGTAVHPDADCTDPTCCVSAEQSAAMVAAEEMRVHERELADEELFRRLDEWSRS